MEVDFLLVHCMQNDVICHVSLSSGLTIQRERGHCGVDQVAIDI